MKITKINKQQKLVSLLGVNWKVKEKQQKQLQDYWSHGDPSLVVPDISGNIQIYLKFTTIFDIEVAQVIENLPYGRQVPLYIYIVNTMSADGLVMQGARVSVGMVLI